MLSKTLAIVVLAGALPHPVVLDRSVTLFTRPEEGEPIQKAAEDLAADFQVVLGRPKIIHRAEDSGPITIFIGESSSVPSEIRPSCLTAPESFSISLREWKSNPRLPTEVIVLSGADMWGTIYAVYQFLDDPETHIVPPVLWDGWEAYYHIMRYEGDRSVDVN